MMGNHLKIMAYISHVSYLVGAQMRRAWNPDKHINIHANARVGISIGRPLCASFQLSQKSTRAFLFDTMPRKPLKAKRFGKALVIREDGRGSRRDVMWLCECDCGNMFRATTTCLNRGKVISCPSCSLKRAGRKRQTHGKTGTRVYTIWHAIKERCLNPNSDSWHNYGGRGVSICDEWLDFETFYKDMGDPPTRSHSIDRIDGDGNYEPSNCRWATRKQQARNKRTNVVLEHNGESLTLAGWAEKLGVDYALLGSRYNRGWPTEEILEAPSWEHGDLHYNAVLSPGKVRGIRKEYATGNCTMQDLADKFCVSLSTISSVIRRDTWAWVNDNQITMDYYCHECDASYDALMFDDWQKLLDDGFGPGKSITWRD